MLKIVLQEIIFLEKNLLLYLKKEKLQKWKIFRNLGATGNNLKNVNLKVPIGTLTCVTGVSGSGKSTLVLQTLFNALNLLLNNNKSRKLPKALETIKGLNLLIKLLLLINLQ